MPKAPSPKRETATKAPTGSGPDLDAYRTPAPNTTGADRSRSSTPPKAEREKRERVQWDQLAGIDGLGIVDFWSDENPDFGPYTGTVVRLPKRGTAPSKDVLVLTSVKTRAGRTLVGAEGRGAFDALDGSGDASVAVHVRAKKSPNYPDGNPQVILTLGGGEASA